MTGESPEERRERLVKLLRRNYSRLRRPEVVTEVARMTGVEPTLDDFLDVEATAALEETARGYVVYETDTHRVWGAQLRAELAGTLRQLADVLQEEAYLLSYPAAGAVRVRVGPLLRYAAEHFEGEQPDLFVAADDGHTGLHLEYRHWHPRSYEYALATWGRFFVDLGDVGASS